LQDIRSRKGAPGSSATDKEMKSLVKFGVSTILTPAGGGWSKDADRAVEVGAETGIDESLQQQP
jgi:hypothetical protein